MKKKIFRAGNYGKKGNYPTELLQSWVDDGKEFSITLGHVGDWMKQGYPRTSIPVGGKAKCIEVDQEGNLYADVDYNEFGKTITETGAYDNFSLGVTKTNKPDHLAVLGYAPPHIKNLSQTFAEFGEEFEEIETYIEFNEGGETMTIKEVIEFLKGMDITETTKPELQKLQNLLFDKMDLIYILEKLTAEGYTVVKEFSEFSEDQLTEITKELLILNLFSHMFF